MARLGQDGDPQARPDSHPESYLRVHVAPFFGQKPIASVTKEDIEEIIVVCYDNDQSIKSTRNYLGFLHSVFDFANSSENRRR